MSADVVKGSSAVKPRRVCLPSGYTSSGQKVRAWCTCGYGTTPRVSRARALDALLTDHGHTAPICALCGKDHSGHDWLTLRTRYVEILTDPLDGPFLVCRGMSRACMDGAAQKQLHRDRAAADGFGFDLPRPSLRVIDGP